MEAMSGMRKNIFVVNAGSSSLKYKVFAMPEEQLLHKGVVERIHNNHVEELKKIATELQSKTTVDAVAHRVVHGGNYFTKATRVNSEVKTKIEELGELAPLHNPVNLTCIKATEAIFKNLPQFAVFDTAFHHTLLPEAGTYAIDRTVAAQLNIRVFGFHGISHQYVSGAAGNFLQKNNSRIISLHLGNGCSIAAIKNGISIDTSMGFSPLSGLIMATRSGDIDPDIPVYLTRKLGWDAAKTETFLNKESGLKGICGMEDMRDINEAARINNPTAILARKLYTYRILKYIGAYTMALGGLDVLIFTGGVGEHDAGIRETICKGMEWMQVKIDSSKNQQASPDRISEINEESSGCKILVIPTNEELEIARQVGGGK